MDWEYLPGFEEFPFQIALTVFAISFDPIGIRRSYDIPKSSSIKKCFTIAFREVARAARNITLSVN